MTETVGISKESKDTKQLPVEVFQEMDARDENQILAEMRGEQLQEFVYSIDVNGRQVINLSYAGAKEYKRQRGHFQIVDVKTEQDEREIRAWVILRDLRNQDEAIGAAAADKSKPFAWTLCLNKSERNAIMKLIPAKSMAVLIKEWLDRNKPRIIPVEARAKGTSVPPESPIPTPLSPPPQPESSSGPVVGEPGSLAAMTDETVAAELDKLPWRINKSKAGGWNVRWDDIPQLIRAKLATKFSELKGTQYVKLAAYSYRRFGDQAEMLARYAIKPSPPTTPSETWTKPPESPVENILVEPWKLKRVPVTKDFDPALTLQSIKQKPLSSRKDQTKSVGMMNYSDDGTEVSLVPEHPIPVKSPPVQTFLLRRALHEMKLKHAKEGFDYCVETDESGQLLKAVLVRGNLTADQVKELANIAAWTFDSALEDKK